MATAFLLFEIVARILAPTLDYDRVHIHALPGIVEEIGDDKRPRVVLLGNSLLMHGADGELLEEEISRAISGPCSITKITPVGTAIGVVISETGASSGNDVAIACLQVVSSVIGEIG